MPLKAGDVKLINLAPSALLDPQGNLQQVPSATFRVRDHGPFFFQALTATETTQQLSNRIRAFATDLIKVLETVPDITRISRAPAQIGTSGSIFAVNVEFRIKNFGPFSAKVPEKEFSAKAMLAEVDKVLTQVNKLLALEV